MIDYKQAYENEALKFQQETRRTSEQAVLLGEWLNTHLRIHKPGPWAKDCELCALVGRTQELLLRPLNAGYGEKVDG
jgi:hypothetical protein